MPLPHIQNTKAGLQLHDPMHASIFEISFELPYALTSDVFAGNNVISPSWALTPDDYVVGDITHEDVVTLTQQVTELSGLDALQKTVQAGEQKFLGTSVSFLNPTHDNTYIEFNVILNLNLRNTTDAWVLRVFKAWSRVGYDLLSGVRTLKAEYVAPFMKILEANRNGVVWREVTLQQVMLVGLTGLDSLNYTDNEARKLQCTFRSDWWHETMGTGEALGDTWELEQSGTVIHNG